jgi:hypothetical protein
MFDFNVTKQSTNPELRPALNLLAAVVAQALKDASASIPKSTRAERGGGAGHITEADIRSAISFLFDPGRLEFFSDKIGFDADSFRAHLICGTSAPWDPSSAISNEEREHIRARAIKYGFLEDVQRLDDLWRLRHGTR